MSDDLLYGPQAFVSASNPSWQERQYVPVDPRAKPHDMAPFPAAYPLDLYHLTQQAFAQDKDALKRWFLTAFVSPEDQHLLTPPEDPTEITTTLEAIKQGLMKPAQELHSEDLINLKEQICALFNMTQWLGVSLAMVDDQQLSIDMLNTLIQWQALVKQFGEQAFSLDTVTNKPLKDHKTPDLNESTVHHIVYGKSTLTLEDLQQSPWGKIAAPLREKVFAQSGSTWEPTLENFERAYIGSYSSIDETAQTLSIEAPSTVLVAHHLLTRKDPSYIIPLYSFGYLAFEDFCAAAFFGGRPMQAYLPAAKGNLYWAHGGYYGEALMVQHDHVHARTYGKFDREVFQSRMRILAIVANALVRVNEIISANRMIDDGQFINLEFALVEEYNRHQLSSTDLFNKRKKILEAIYNEFALAAGIKLDFICLIDGSTDNGFLLNAQYQDKTLSFKVDLSMSHDQSKQLPQYFNEAFNTILALAKPEMQQQPQQHIEPQPEQKPQQQPPSQQEPESQLQQVLPPEQSQTQNATPPVILKQMPARREPSAYEKALPWMLRVCVFCFIMGGVSLALGLTGMFFNPLATGVILGISALVATGICSRILRNIDQEMGDVFALQPITTVPTPTNPHLNQAQPHPRPHFMWRLIHAHPTNNTTSTATQQHQSQPAIF